ncbi:DivIVA domain-containing protein [Salinithrix halophila]|uniref:DivIVA domain-containing protein n=1 Tax=Salinithrix halophila TaxID=1485204 RepID=A0ABV8JE18_9BACL
MLTPLDIHQKEFSISFRGYHTDEVNDFLDLVIKDFDILLGGEGMLKLSPQEIQNKKFSKIIRGYDIDEVNDFLNQVIQDYEALLLQGTEPALYEMEAVAPPTEMIPRITPDEIHQQEFSRVSTGYDMEEVNRFLDRIIHDYALTLEENQALAARLQLYEERFGPL